MSRLPDSVRNQLVDAITDLARAGRTKDGCYSAELLAQQEPILRSRLAKIAKKHQGIHVVGDSIDAVPGIEFFLAEPRLFSGNPPASQAKEPESLAEEIVAEFESWPRLYDHIVSLPFPREIFDSVFDTRYILSDEVRVEVLSDVDLKVLGIDENRQSYVLRVAIPGFDLATGLDKLGRIESVTRQFFGLAIASGLIEGGRVRWQEPELRHHKPVHLTIADIGPITASEFVASGFMAENPYLTDDALPEEDSAVIAALVLPEEYGIPRLSDELEAWTLGLGYALWRSHMPRFRQALHEIGFVFRQNDTRLLSAGEWLFSSYVGQNQALQMVQAMTVLEILFGGAEAERQGASLTKLLATRCAYFLAPRPAERVDIEKEVKRLYDLRSDVVHGGVRRLKDESELQRARDLCKRAIKKELRFMAAVEPP